MTPLLKTLEKLVLTTVKGQKIILTWDLIENLPSTVITIDIERFSSSGGVHYFHWHDVEQFLLDSANKSQYNNMEEKSGGGSGYGVCARCGGCVGDNSPIGKRKCQYNAYGCKD